MKPGCYFNALVASKKSSRQYEFCCENKIPYIQLATFDDVDDVTFIVDSHPMEDSPSQTGDGLTVFHFTTMDSLPRLEQVCTLIYEAQTLDGFALSGLLEEVLDNENHVLLKCELPHVTPRQSLLRDDPETSRLHSHLTPLLEDMILLSIELQTECGATSVSLSRIVANEIGLTEELVVRYLLANGWRRDAGDPDCFWAPRWQRHKRTEQDYQQAESWVLAVAPSAESCC